MYVFVLSLIMENKFKEFYDGCIGAWGKKSQMVLAIEEMSELQKEICKYLRTEENTCGGNDKKIEDIIENIREEIADVFVTVGEMAYIFGEDEVEKIKERKLERGRKRLEDWNKKPQV